MSKANKIMNQHSGSVASGHESLQDGSSDDTDACLFHEFEVAKSHGMLAKRYNNILKLPSLPDIDSKILFAIQQKKPVKSQDGLRYFGKIDFFDYKGGYIKFYISGNVDRAFFFRYKLHIDAQEMNSSLPNTDILYREMPVELYATVFKNYSPANGRDIKYKAEYVGCHPAYFGIIQSVSRRTGFVKFLKGKRIEKAFFHKDFVFVQGNRVKDEESLNQVFRENAPVILAVEFYDDKTDAKFKAVYVESLPEQKLRKTLVFSETKKVNSNTSQFPQKTCQKKLEYIYGLTGIVKSYVSPHTGIVKCFIKGVAQDIRFSKKVVRVPQMYRGFALQKCVPCSQTVYFDLSYDTKSKYFEAIDLWIGKKSECVPLLDKSETLGNKSDASDSERKENGMTPDKSKTKNNENIVSDEQTLIKDKVLVNCESTPPVESNTLVNSRSIPSVEKTTVESNTLVNSGSLPAVESNTLVNSRSIPAVEKTTVESNILVNNGSILPVESNTLVNSRSIPAVEKTTVESNTLVNSGSLPAVENNTLVNSRSIPAVESRTFINSVSIPPVGKTTDESNTLVNVGSILSFEKTYIKSSTPVHSGNILAPEKKVITAATSPVEKLVTENDKHTSEPNIHTLSNHPGIIMSVFSDDLGVLRYKHNGVNKLGTFHKNVVSVSLNNKKDNKMDLRKCLEIGQRVYFNGTYLHCNDTNALVITSLWISEQSETQISSQNNDIDVIHKNDTSVGECTNICSPTIVENGAQSKQNGSVQYSFDVRSKSFNNEFSLSDVKISEEHKTGPDIPTMLCNISNWVGTVQQYESDSEGIIEHDMFGQTLETRFCKTNVCFPEGITCRDLELYLPVGSKVNFNADVKRGEKNWLSITSVSKIVGPHSLDLFENNDDVGNTVEVQENFEGEDVFQGIIKCLVCDIGIVKSDEFEELCFSSHRTFLFGVPLKDYNLEQIFHTGDVVQYIYTEDVGIHKLWIGCHDAVNNIEESILQLRTFCVNRHIDLSVTKRLINDFNELYLSEDEENARALPLGNCDRNFSRKRKSPKHSDSSKGGSAISEDALYYSDDGENFNTVDFKINKKVSENCINNRDESKFIKNGSNHILNLREDEDKVNNGELYDGNELVTVDEAKGTDIQCIQEDKFDEADGLKSHVCPTSHITGENITNSSEDSGVFYDKHAGSLEQFTLPSLIDLKNPEVGGKESSTHTLMNIFHPNYINVLKCVIRKFSEVENDRELDKVIKFLESKIHMEVCSKMLSEVLSVQFGNVCSEALKDEHQGENLTGQGNDIQNQIEFVNEVTTELKGRMSLRSEASALSDPFVPESGEVESSSVTNEETQTISTGPILHSNVFTG